MNKDKLFDKFEEILETTYNTESGDCLDCFTDEEKEKHWDWFANILKELK